MTEIIEGVLNVDSWPQVVVIVAGLAYLAIRAHYDGKRVRKAADHAEHAATSAAITAHEVQNNSGKSLKDVAERTESNTTDVLTAVQAVSDKLDAHLSVAVEESATLVEVKETTDRLREKFLDE